MLGNDPLTEAIIAFVNLQNALMIVAVYSIVVGAYLADEMGFRDFPRWYSRVTLYLFAAGSPAFLLVAMVFAFLWGFSA